MTFKSIKSFGTPIIDLLYHCYRFGLKVTLRGLARNADDHQLLNAVKLLKLILTNTIMHTISRIQKVFFLFENFRAG